MAVRTSLSDFDFDGYNNSQNTTMIYIRWIIWLISAFIMNVILMNFIIAVISESYDKIMQKLAI